MGILDASEPVITGYKDLINRPVHPDLAGPPKPGRIYFTGKIFTNLTMGQKIRTGSNNPDSRRKNQKSRPWLVLDVWKDGNLSVISLTTRNNKIWEGLVGNDVNSFLPLGSTPAIPGRGSVELLSNTCGIFKGTSLIFLEVERVVPASWLGHPVGEISPEGLALVQVEKEKCVEYWRNQPKDRQVYTGRRRQQPSYIPRGPTPASTGRSRTANNINLGDQRLDRNHLDDMFYISQIGRTHFDRAQYECDLERQLFEIRRGHWNPIEGRAFEREQFERSRGPFCRDQAEETGQPAFRRWILE